MTKELRLAAGAFFGIVACYAAYDHDLIFSFGTGVWAFLTLGFPSASEQ